MRIWSLRRSSRPVSWTGATLVVLVAALVHLLACAHGPASAGPGRADAILVVSTASWGQPSQTAVGTSAKGLDSTEGGGVHCWGPDETAAGPPRDITPTAQAALHVLPSEGIDALTGVVPARPSRCPDPAVHPVQQERARLGVWRT
ncbi:hypothetical protein AB0L99_26960 [Streptomyces sp. NPDC051954]|uniref:hypothetical protein n=1 Tax=Streptomyces sp. NPDC051954 TaxID=3155524 RepID=UPI00341F12B3